MDKHYTEDIRNREIVWLTAAQLKLDKAKSMSHERPEAKKEIQSKINHLLLNASLLDGKQKAGSAVYLIGA